MFDASERDRPQNDGPVMGIDPGTLDDDQLVAEVSKVASELAAGNARLLELIATAQERSLWSRWGALHPWQWVSCLTGFSPRLAKDQALVADKLPSLPKTHEALATGEISFCQASSIAKVERDDLEDELVALAKDLTQGQLDTVLRAYRRASAPMISPRSTPPTTEGSSTTSLSTTPSSSRDGCPKTTAH